MEKDMTKGSPMRLILGFAVPLLLGLIFQQFYSMVDTIIVGHYLGVDALAAVGATGSVNFLIIGFCMGVCSGFAIPIAQEFGAKHEENLRRYGKLCLAFGDFCGRDDDRGGDTVPSDPVGYAYTRGYHRWLLQIYCGDFPRDSGHLSV